MTGKCIDCQNGLIAYKGDEIYGTLVVCKDGWVKHFMDESTELIDCDGYRLRESYRHGSQCRFCERFRNGKCQNRVPNYIMNLGVPNCEKFRRNGHRKETEK